MKKHILKEISLPFKIWSANVCGNRIFSISPLLRKEVLWQLFILLLKMKAMVQECEFNGGKSAYEYIAYIFSERKHYKKIHKEI